MLNVANKFDMASNEYMLAHLRRNFCSFFKHFAFLSKRESSFCKRLKCRIQMELSYAVQQHLKASQ